MSFNRFGRSLALLLPLACCSPLGFEDPPAGDIFDQSYVSAAIQKGNGRVFFYRTIKAYKPTRTQIKANGIVIGAVYQGSLQRLDFAAGHYIFTMGDPSMLAFGHLTIPLDIADGQTNFIEISVSASEVAAGGTIIFLPGSPNNAGPGAVGDCGGGYCAHVETADQALPRLQNLIVDK